MNLFVRPIGKQDRLFVDFVAVEHFDLKFAIHGEDGVNNAFQLIGDQRVGNMQFIGHVGTTVAPFLLQQVARTCFNFFILCGGKFAVMKGAPNTCGSRQIGAKSMQPLRSSIVHCQGGKS